MKQNLKMLGLIAAAIVAVATIALLATGPAPSASPPQSPSPTSATTSRLSGAVTGGGATFVAPQMFALV